MLFASATSATAVVWVHKTTHLVCEPAFCLATGRCQVQDGTWPALLLSGVQRIMYDGYGMPRACTDGIAALLW